MMKIFSTIATFVANRFNQNIKQAKTVGCGLMLLASSAHSLPTLFFDGSFAYDSGSQVVSVDSVLTSTTGISPAPSVQGTLTFQAELTSSFSGLGFTIGSFGTLSGQDDIQVYDASSNLLLSGNFSSLTMSGSDGLDNGVISGDLISNGGLLASQFGAGNVVALQFGLQSAAFGSSMFSNDFTGLIDGNLQGQAVSVSEPDSLLLLGFGALLVGFTRARKYISA